VLAVRDVAYPELQKIARAELAIDSEIEQSELPRSLLELEANADRPNLLEAQWCLLPDEFAFVPRFPVPFAFGTWLFHDDLPVKGGGSRAATFAGEELC